MITSLTFFAIIAIVAVSSGQEEAFLTTPIPVLLRSEVRDDAGQYSLSYSTGDGQSHSEQGLLKRNSDGTGNVLVKQGGYTFVNSDGTKVIVTYVADENGFQPVHHHIPQPVSQLPVT